ncbi:hypothetical protein KAH81_06140 [bacterium]|nr:hypothetical protein [bacterium]
MKRAILLITALSFIAMGYTYHGAFFLDGPVMPSSAATSAMGGLKVLPPEEPASALWAPSCLPRDGINIGVNLNLINASEERALPLFDSFEDRVGWTPYVSMKETYPTFGGFVSYGFEGDWIPTIAAGYSVVFDAEYIYREQVRQREDPNADRLIGTWSLDSDGALAGPTFAVREDILDYGSIGISATLLSGTIEMHRSPEAQDSVVHNTEPWEAAFDDDTVYSADLSGTMISLSAVATPTDRWQIGLRWTPEVDLGESLYPDFLPSRIGIGIGYRPPGYVVSRAVVEFEFVGYSALAEEDSAFAQLEDSWEFRIGLEHKLANNIPLRLGAYHYRIPLVDQVVRTGFTLGSGVAFGKVKVDVFGGYQMSTYYQHDQFPESWLPSPYETANREDMDRVNESLLVGGFTVAVDL